MKEFRLVTFRRNKMKWKIYYAQCLLIYIVQYLYVIQSKMHEKKIVSFEIVIQVNVFFFFCKIFISFQIFI